jgi:hypothetical protein
MGKNNYNLNCFKCKHFTVTWDPSFPRACNFYNFKSARIPSIVVYEATGTVCGEFEKKRDIDERPPEAHSL